MSNRLKSVQQCVEAGLIPEAEQLVLQPVADLFSIGLTNEMAEIAQNSIAVSQQFVPDTAELLIADDELEDPIGDQSFSPVPGVVHRHHDRCLLLPVNVCAVYCRFCFRREKIGPGNAAMTPAQLQQAYDYIQSRPEIWEVILTGGDPLMLKPKALRAILLRLRSIPHVKIIRLHTRIPVVDSQRISPELVEVLAEHAPTYVVLHTNHADEFHPAARKACQQLIRAGVPMLSQSVLLKGINDSVDAMEQLMRTLVELGVKPYYVHQLDKARGTSHFKVSVDQGLRIMRELRERASGLCQPTYVVDTPGGTGGKTPIYSEL